MAAASPGPERRGAGARGRLRPRPAIEALTPYVPGRPAGSRDGSLASNESPLPTSAAVQRALRAAGHDLNRYPDPLAGELRARLGEELGVDPEQVLVGNGSDELIYLLVIAYAAGGGRVLCADPPYRVHEIAALALGAEVVRVPLRDWAHDLEQMAGVEAELAFIGNPHNPTGTALPREQLEHFLRTCRARLVAVDEAYLDFCDDALAVSSIPLVASGRLVCLRTFSKIAGLAGARVGYMVGSVEIVAALRRFRPAFSVSSLAQAAALAALADDRRRQRLRRYTIRSRRRLAALFREHGYASLPSQANFILVLAPDEQRLVERLAAAGISARPGSTLGVPGAVRLSVPSPAGFELLERALAGS
ncbi:MAG: pyridoxal phosphate-dependent aminotransferase [Candidatus Dormibacteria bacterium]